VYRIASLALAFVLVQAPAEFSPARLRSGEPPIVPIQSVGWAQGIVEATVTPGGAVRSVDALTPGTPFAQAVAEAVGGWRFSPARVTDDKGTVDDVGTHVLVVGLLRPPELVASMPAPLDMPRTSPDVPRPVKLTPPAYPPLALGNGVVVVEVSVDAKGAVTSTSVVRSASGFNSAALEALGDWRFDPARREGTPVPGVAYVVFGFRAPLITKKQTGPRP
jgi:TonB family protein